MEGKRRHTAWHKVPTKLLQRNVRKTSLARQVTDREPYIIEALRTPVGRYGGALKDVRPDDLAALVIKELVARTGVDPTRIEDVILGCANQAGEDNRNVARMAVLLAGL